MELFAQLCTEYGLNPLGHGVIISHHEGYLQGVASNHGDPEHLWKGLGLGYTMDGFRKDVKAAMEGKTVKKYTLGWHKDSLGWWYADTENSYYQDRWAKIGGHWYDFDEKGYMLMDTWKVDSTGTYYLGADGKMQKNMIVGLGADGKLQPMERWFHLLSDLPDYYRAEIDPLIAAGKIKGKSGTGENMVLDMSEGTVRAIIVLSR